MSNHLANTHSPYLMQHQHNPVDWYPWGEEAFEKARREDKPIFLSIGYSTCHWCHVMAHESFEDEAVARLLNREYVSIKVDREERPDVDAVYMQVCQALTGTGGWPLTIFMTPDQKPLFGRTTGSGCCETATSLLLRSGVLQRQNRVRPRRSWCATLIRSIAVRLIRNGAALAALRSFRARTICCF